MENYTPKIIVTKEYDNIIKDVRIRYLADEWSQFNNERGEVINYKKKVIKDDIRDIKENCFDGCGIMHPTVAERISRMFGFGEKFNSCIIRALYIKGCIHKVDYTKFFMDRGIEWIKDIWGVEHSIYEPMIIIDESMYNGSFDVRFIDNLLYKKDVKIENKVTEPLFDYNWLDEEKK